MNYYKEIKDILIKNETYKRVKDYSKNRNELNSYYEVGKILVEAQGGEDRAKYGNKLIKTYSERLTKEIGKGYDERNLRYMRMFYIKFQNWNALRSNLSWSHYRVLLPLKSMNEINYYIMISEKENLSYRKLEERIKSNEYERIGYKEELEEPKINTLIKNPVIINTKLKVDKDIKEYTMHNLILEDMENFLKELGVGFAVIAHEVKIENNNSMDFLLFNYNYNCFVVVEIKVTKLKAEYIGQTLKYVNYVDKNIKKPFHDKTVGIIISKKQDKFVLEYCTNPNIFTTTYKLKEAKY